MSNSLLSKRVPKQTVIARSNTKAEYRNLAAVTADILWFQTLMHEISAPCLTTVVFCDNQTVEHLAHNPILHACTKHMELDLFFTERVISKQIQVCTSLVQTSLLNC